MANSRAEQFRAHIEGLSEEERGKALATTVGQIYLAVQGVSQQADRLRASHSVTYTEHQNDALFFIFALHRFMRLLVLAVKLAEAEDGSLVQAALDRLAAAASDTQATRDVLSHLDEYLTGFGKVQDDARPSPLPWFLRAGTSYTVIVGEYKVDVDAAESAALEAFSAALVLDS